MRRRKPDTIEVQQMKAQAKEDKVAKITEKNKLESERKARDAAEAKKRELEEKIAKFEEQNEKLMKGNSFHSKLIVSVRTNVYSLANRKLLTLYTTNQLAAVQNFIT